MDEDNENLRRIQIAQYERKIQDLITNNNTLTNALNTSNMTINQQSMTISNLEKKLTSQQLLDQKFRAIDKAIQQLNQLWKDTESLFEDQSSSSPSQLLAYRVNHINPSYSNQRSTENNCNERTWSLHSYSPSRLDFPRRNTSMSYNSTRNDSTAYNSTRNDSTAYNLTRNDSTAYNSTRNDSTAYNSTRNDSTSYETPRDSLASYNPNSTAEAFRSFRSGACLANATVSNNSLASFASQRDSKRPSTGQKTLFQLPSSSDEDIAEPDDSVVEEERFVQDEQPRNPVVQSPPKRQGRKRKSEDELNKASTIKKTTKRKLSEPKTITVKFAKPKQPKTPKTKAKSLTRKPRVPKTSTKLGRPRFRQRSNSVDEDVDKIVAETEKALQEKNAAAIASMSDEAETTNDVDADQAADKDFQEIDAAESTNDDQDNSLVVATNKDSVTAKYLNDLRAIALSWCDTCEYVPCAETVKVGALCTRVFIKGSRGWPLVVLTDFRRVASTATLMIEDSTIEIEDVDPALPMVATEEQEATTYTVDFPPNDGEHLTNGTTTRDVTEDVEEIGGMMNGVGEDIDDGDGIIRKDFIKPPMHVKSVNKTSESSSGSSYSQRVM